MAALAALAEINRWRSASNIADDFAAGRVALNEAAKLIKNLTEQDGEKDALHRIKHVLKQRFKHLALAAGWSDGRYDLRFALAAHVWSLQHFGSASSKTTAWWI